MRPVRVAFFVFNTANGDLRVHRQASLLARHGYQVRIFCFLEPGLPQREERSGYTIVREDQRSLLTRFFDDQVMRRWKKPKKSSLVQDGGWRWPVDREAVRPCPKPPTRALPKEFAEGEERYLAYVRRINQIWASRARRWKPDVCQAHDLDALEAAALTAQACKARLIYDTHELWTDQPFIRSQATVDYWNRLEKQWIHSCQAVLTVNRPFAEVLSQRYQIDVQPLHNCQELQEIKGPRGVLRERLGGRPVALYQGVLGLDRGLEELIASARHQSVVHIALRGYGPKRGELVAMAQQVEGVTVLDPCPSDEIVERAAEGDMGVIPFLPTCLNHYYNTPNKLFEYMMAGLPMAASDLPDLSNFIAGGQFGLLFDPFSPADIARALVELWNHPEREQMGQRARQACVERYHWEKEGETLLNCYHRLGL